MKVAKNKKAIITWRPLLQTTFVFITFLLLFYSCHQKSKQEMQKKDRAIELVQNYTPAEGMRLIDWMTQFFNLPQITTVIEVNGWYAEKKSEQVYRVTFSYSENTIEKKIEWAVNIQTEQISPIDEQAAFFMQSFLQR